jgi:hypothetical protein
MKQNEKKESQGKSVSKDMDKTNDKGRDQKSSDTQKKSATAADTTKKPKAK